MADPTVTVLVVGEPVHGFPGVGPAYHDGPTRTDDGLDQVRLHRVLGT